MVGVPDKTSARRERHHRRQRACAHTESDRRRAATRGQRLIVGCAHCGRWQQRRTERQPEAIDGQRVAALAETAIDIRCPDSEGEVPCCVGVPTSVACAELRVTKLKPAGKLPVSVQVIALAAPVWKRLG